MTDRPVHAGSQLLVGPVGCRRQGGLRRTQVLQAGPGDGFPTNNKNTKFINRQEHKETCRSMCDTDRELDSV